MVNLTDILEARMQEITRHEQRMDGMEAMLKKICAYIDKEEQADDAAFISGTEARALFKPAISKSTLQRWCNDGLINKRRIGGKVVYSKKEIQEAVKKLRTYKTKRPVETDLVMQ